jgi:ArsR family metal-binding transcriptional regulator
MVHAKQMLENSAQNKILVYTPHIIIIRNKKAETTLSKDGRMLIRRVSNEEEATQVARQILTAILKP